MENQAEKIDLAHSEILAGLSVVLFIVMEYEDQISTKDFFKIKEQVYFAKGHADELQRLAHGRT